MKEVAVSNPRYVRRAGSSVYIPFQVRRELCYLRINAMLRQFDEFLDFYGITEGDSMFPAPEDRVVIW